MTDWHIRWQDHKKIPIQMQKKICKSINDDEVLEVFSFIKTKSRIENNNSPGKTRTPATDSTSCGSELPKSWMADYENRHQPDGRSSQPRKTLKRKENILFASILQLSKSVYDFLMPLWTLWKSLKPGSVHTCLQRSSLDTTHPTYLYVNENCVCPKCSPKNQKRHLSQRILLFSQTQAILMFITSQLMAHSGSTEFDSQ